MKYSYIYNFIIEKNIIHQNTNRHYHHTLNVQQQHEIHHRKKSAVIKSSTYDATHRIEHEKSSHTLAHTHTLHNFEKNFEIGALRRQIETRECRIVLGLRTSFFARFIGWLLCPSLATSVGVRTSSNAAKDCAELWQWSMLIESVRRRRS